MRNYEKEFAQRVQFIKRTVRESGADGIVYGNSGGKDSALVGILCKAACDNTVGIIMPCATARNFEMDKRDGACDFNPIADLTVTEIYEFLRYLKAPKCVIEKAPSAGLFDGQTDESEMGFTYKELDTYLDGGKIDDAALERIQRMHARSEHKRREILTF